MVVYDIKGSTPAKVNRHLGNIKDAPASKQKDPAYDTIDIDLDGYTMFMAYSHEDIAKPQQIFHAHYVPTSSNRSEELRFQRYNREYDVQIWPSFKRNPEFREEAGRTDVDQLRYELNRENAKDNRNKFLLKDSKGKHSVVPYK